MENSIKICSCCNLSKTLDCFRKEKSRYRAKCKSCTKETQDKYILENKDKKAVWNKKYSNANKEKIKQYLTKPEVRQARKVSSKKTYEKHKSEYIKKQTAYAKTKRDVINNRARENWDNCYEKYKDRYKLKSRMRDRKIRMQVIAKFFKQQIQDIYKKCLSLKNETMIDFEVDHIIPLNGETVSGLHVPWNLQILTKEENLKKSNKWIKD